MQCACLPCRLRRGQLGGMERVLCQRGWEPKDARVSVARMATILTPGWPDFLG